MKKSFPLAFSNRLLAFAALAFATLLVAPAAAYASSPQITPSVSSLGNFSAFTDTNSTSQSFTIHGTYLTANLTELIPLPIRTAMARRIGWNISLAPIRATRFRYSGRQCTQRPEN
jgi:hypothetical protein